MSPNVDSPVQTQMAVEVLNRSLSSDYHQSRSKEGRPVGRRRRVFVQTETGSVLGIEFDRRDNAHTVKRRLQLALDVPTEESSLTYGDLVLKNDLSVIRNDSPLLLTRNLMHRSSSTPCLSPTGKDLQQKDWSGPIEILGCSSRCSRMKQLIKDVVKAVKNGVDPIPVRSGLGGAYYFRNCMGENVAIVKPTDEEPFAPNNPKGFVGKALGQPGLKRSVRVGETGFREVAAYLLDYDHFANVPPTVLVKITHSIFHVNDSVNCSKNKVIHKKPQAMSKIASFQQFIHHDFDASDHGTSSFPVAAVHRIGILDVRIFNTDRHGGNLLVRKLEGKDGRFGGQMELIPIDHGLCLPENLEDPYFEWIHWPQASIPFSEDELDYIARLDPVRDSDMLRMELPMIHEACLRVLILCTVFLKEAAAFGLCLAEIGEMMSREFRGMEEEPSELEVLCIEARKLVAEPEILYSETGSECEDDTQFLIECNGDEQVMPLTPQSYKSENSKNPFSKLESLEEEDEDYYDEERSMVEITRGLSMSLNGVSLVEKNRQRQGNSEVYQGDIMKTNRSANEQLLLSPSFVKFADMNEEEWGAFLEKFQELLYIALQSRKSSSVNQWQRQRLGTSCQF
ncbi:hypothetical protein J5N97_005157 [Dioscorea zingiberensis]|uniref:1-phosphatidylinositol 4-kinase n=1 Tax=Dioscorea zingiberensis TaxID=325984 RepID=A0A9D5D812_9LILI|nr:hypothetical protein J5N97_005157 [Dioscorea zingiberensis]